MTFALLFVMINNLLFDQLVRQDFDGKKNQKSKKNFFGPNALILRKMTSESNLFQQFLVNFSIRFHKKYVAFGVRLLRIYFCGLRSRWFKVIRVSTQLKIASMTSLDIKCGVCLQTFNTGNYSFCYLLQFCIELVHSIYS